MNDLPPGFQMDQPAALPPGFQPDPAPEPGFLQRAGQGMAAAFSGMGRNLGAGMQGTSPSTGDKRLVGEYAMTDAGHDVKLPDGQHRRIDPSREVVLSDPVSKRVMVYERDQPVDSVSARADAAGRLLGIGAMSGAPQGINAATAATKARSAIDTMRAANVKMTPGQAAGGVFQKVEDKATSWPIIGDLINYSRAKGIDSFNRATANKVLEPIGQTLDKGAKPGREMISEVGQRVSKAYEDLLPGLTLKPDKALVADISAAKAKVAELPAEIQTVFNKTIDNRLLARFGEGAMDGKTLKATESDLGRLATQYRSSADSFQRTVGEAIGDVQAAIRSALTRSNPEQAEALKEVNRAYAMLLRMENAGAAAGSKEGVFTPAALRAATKAKDGSLNKRAYARGDAVMQDFAEAAEKALGSTMPNSGTADRTLQALMAGNLVSGGASAAGWIDPMTAAIMSAAALPYMPYGRGAVVGLMGQAPALRRSLPGGTGLMSVGANDPRLRAGR